MSTRSSNPIFRVPLRLAFRVGRGLGTLFGLDLLQISGPSMEPALADGDYLIFRKTTSSRPAKSLQGRTLVVRHPQFGRIVKLARPGSTAERIALEGLSTFSTAPEHLGEVALEAVEGIGVARIAPKGLSLIKRIDPSRPS